MRGLLWVCGLLALTSSAHASGGLDCEADDAKVAFAVHGGVTRGMGGPLFQFNGELTIKDQAVAEDLRKIAFEREHVAQYWFDGDELKLDIYREREGDKPFGSVELIVRTTSAGDEGGFEGRYELVVYDGTGEGAEAKEARYDGKVSCGTE